MTDPHLEDAIFGERPKPATRRERRVHGPKDRSGTTKAALVVGLVLMVGAVVFAASSLRPMVGSFLDRNDYGGPGEGSVQYTVEQGASGGDIAAGLAKLDVVKTRAAFVEAASQDPAKSSSIQPGTYPLKKQMKASDALAVLADPAQRVDKGLTIPEGKWASEVYEALAKDSGDTVAEYEKAAAKLDLPDEAKGKVEGWLFPNTYNFGKDETPQERLQRMVDETVKQLKANDVPRDKWERTLIVASIVEGESGEADRGKVARVVENRLVDRSGLINGMLQMDSTVHYIYQGRGDAGTTDEMRANPSPYNTYKHPGLPPGPINNPGAAAIKAAADPTPGDWLYFVTVNPDTGETRFTNDFAEHQKNQTLFNEWYREHGSTASPSS